VGVNLLKLLTGEINPLDLLFRGKLVKDHYYSGVSRPQPWLLIFLLPFLSTVGYARKQADSGEMGMYVSG
jgi:hypothetical protein